MSVTRGYSAIDITGKDTGLYKPHLPALSRHGSRRHTEIHKGMLALTPKSGQPLKSRVEALDDPRGDTPDLLPPAGAMDTSSLDTMTANGRSPGNQ